MCEVLPLILERAAHLVANSLEIQNSQPWYSPGKPFAIPLLFLHRVSQQRQVLQARNILQRFEIAKLGDVVVREDEGSEVRYGKMKGWGDGGYSVVGEQYRP